MGFTKVVASLFLLCAGIILVGAGPTKSDLPDLTINLTPSNTLI